LNFCTRIQAEIENEYAIPNDEYQELSPSLKYRCPSLKLSQNREILNNEESKLHWELQYQSQLAELESEKAHLDSLPLIVYSTEDGGRASSKSWHGRDGQPMGIWTPPMPSTMHQLLQDPSGTELSFNYLSYLYDTDMLNLMDDTELPPVYVKKELAPMNIKLEPMLGTNLHGLSPSGEMTALNPIDYKTKIRNENYGPLAGMIPGPTYAPRSLFDRPVNPQKVRPKVPRPHPQPGTGRDGLPSKVPPLPFHPLPRPQVEAENVPDWLVSEDWALLTAVRDLLELPLNLQATSPAHTPNWDMVADMVNSVSYVYRGPRQCRNRYETIVVPREEGRILFDLSSIAPPDLSQIGTPTSKKKKKQEKKNLSQPLPKPNRPIKTATLFKQDDNRAWTQMFGNRFGSIKAVALKRAPTTKPLVVNPVPKNSKHAQVLSESGISYDAPLNPISVAANRAERIQKEKQRTQQDQQQQRLATAQQVASAVQQTAAAQRTAAVAVQQHQSQGTVITAPRGVTVASLPVQATQPQQATVVQASVTPGQQSSIQGPQAVVVGISQPITSVTNTQHVVQQQAQHQNVLQTTGRNLQQIGVQELIRVSQQQAQSAHQAQQPTVVVSGQHQQPTSVGTVINLTPSQMQAAQKLVGQSSVVTTRVAGTASGGLVSFAGKQLTPQQFNALRQQALLKKNQQDAQTAAAIAKARLQGLQPTAVPQATAVTLSAAGGQVQQAGTIMGQATTSTGQKVSVAVTPGGAVSIANVANAVSASGNVVVTSPMTGAVTVVTQASGQPKAHLIRQVNSMGKGTVRAFSDSEMKLLLQKQQQHQLQQQSGQTKTQIQLPTHVTSSTGNTAITAQLLAQHGIQVQQTPGGPSVATLVKTSTAGASSSGLPTQSVTIPVAAGAMNLPQIRAALTRSGVTNPQQMQLLQKQLLQRQQIAKQQGIAVGQAGKGMPAQLIVSSGGNPVAGQKQGLPQSVSVQQIQQIVKAGQVINATPPSSGGNATVVTQGQILPHSAILTAKTGSSPATVQARVIPVSSGALNASANAAPLGSNIGRTQQIQVVAASPNQAVNAALRQVGVASGAAPNVTVDASGRPTSGTGAASTTTTQFANAYAAAAAAGGSPTIRIQGGSGQQQQQIISQVSAAFAASSSGGHPVSVAVRGPTASVLAAAQQVTQQQQVTATVSTAATSSSKLQPNNTVSIANTSSVTGSPSTGNEKK
jgi:E1A-binding protein p400